ncbi:hypothetical protein MKW92_008132, partial [Papaver armeniacum]
MLRCHVFHNPLEKQLKQIGNGRTIHWYNRRRIRVMVAKRISKFDTQVVPVSPEDIPINDKSCLQYWSIYRYTRNDMNVARMNMSHGDHASHQKVIDLVKEYTAQSKDNVIAIMLDAKDSVKCEVVDGGDLKSRRHLNDWDDIKFGLGNKVDFYAVSFVKNAKVTIPNLHSMITASDG